MYTADPSKPVAPPPATPALPIRKAARKSAAPRRALHAPSQRGGGGRRSRGRGRPRTCSPSSSSPVQDALTYYPGEDSVFDPSITSGHSVMSSDHVDADPSYPEYSDPEPLLEILGAESADEELLAFSELVSRGLERGATRRRDDDRTDPDYVPSAAARRIAARPTRRRRHKSSSTDSDAPASSPSDIVKGTPA